jgi:DNA-directed RNA polymerase specialized sigma24 family protein
MSTTALTLAPGSRVVIRRYSTRAHGIVEVLDLEQEAALQALETASRPDIRDRDSYETRAVASELCWLVAAMQTPVSLPQHKGETWAEAAACRRAPITGGHGEDESAEDHPALAGIAAEAFEPIENVIDTERAAAELHRILAEESEAARLCLLEEEKPQTVAQRLGVAVSQVYLDTARAMRHLRAALCPMREV